MNEYTLVISRSVSEIYLRDRLALLDGQGYKAYKSLRGSYSFSEFTLHIEYVQGDPFAAPSQVRVAVSQAIAQFPDSLVAQPSRRLALEDFLIRQFYRRARTYSQSRGSGKSGLIEIAPPSQAILPRTAACVTAAAVELQFFVGLPAFGRRIAGSQAITLLCDDLPRLLGSVLRYSQLDAAALAHHCQVAENADWLRGQLSANHLVAFVANGAVLPRRSGADERPLETDVVPFVSPESLQVCFTLPNGDSLTGMGLSKGITLLVGGGYHGKSTLLQAMMAGVYNHIPGDGREYVVTDAAAMKVRAEDGRSVKGVDISPFINHLPQDKPTQHFSTPDASGSTSQAAGIVEALEAGARVLLMDEDTSATNFMIRDRRMQALIAKSQEPITPFVDKVQQLYADYGISTVLVMGGSGDYFDVADTIIALDNYRVEAVTAAAKAIAKAHPTSRQAEGGQNFGVLASRIVLPGGIDPRKGKRAVSLGARATDEIRLGTETIDLSGVEQLIEPGQLRAIAAAMLYTRQHYLDGQRTLSEVLQQVATDIHHQGLGCLGDRDTSGWVYFRPLELAAAFNRLRTLQVAP